MAIHTTYSNARANFSKLLKTVSEDKEVIVINRRNKEDVALISSSELKGLMETAHLLRSPQNAKRLLSALHRSFTDSEPSSSLEQLKSDLGFEEQHSQ